MLKKLKQKYGELASGKYEDDTMVQAAAMATMMLDPFYIAAYMTPWGRAATATLKGVSALSGVTVGLDTMLNNLATTGTVDVKSVGISAASAAALGPLTVKAFGAIKSLLPSANTAQIQKIIGVVEGQKAKQLGISKVEFKKLQSIAGDKELLEINKQLQKAAKNWVAPIANETKLFNATEKSLQNRIKNLTKDTKDVEALAYFKSAKDSTLKELQKTLKIKNKTLADKTKEFNLKQKELWKQTAAQERKLTDLVAKRDYTILKKLKEQKSLTRNLAEGLISASVRPALGAGIGYAFGRLWGGEDANLNNWMLAGASLGALNKMIQRSGTVFATGEKNLLENIMYNNATKNAFQKVRELTATTTSTKLKAIGGETEKIGMKLFQELDSPVSKFSASAVSDKLKLDYSNRAFKLVAGTTQDEQAAAIRIVRGSKEKGTPKVQKLAADIKKYLDDFRKEYTDVGIGLRKTVTKKGKEVTERIDPIKDYFPRVWNWDKVKEDPEKFKRVLTEIFKNKKVKDPKKSAEDFYSSLSTHNEKGFYSKEAVTELVNSVVAGKQVTTKRGLIRNLPLSDHIENDRVLSGTYGQVEKLLSKNGYLIDDIPAVFNKLIASSADSIAFARQFGAKGELLNDYIKNIVTKYAGNPNQSSLASKEIKLVMDSIDGFFGRYGQVRQGIVKSGAGILSTISNLNMLDRVTIASLGDLVQPFTNSSNFTSWIKGLSRTAVTAKGETGLARNLGQAQSNEIRAALQKPLAIKGDEISSNASWLGEGGGLAKTNNLFFKLSGLEWITGFARRFAYNAGATDAYLTSRKLANFVNKGGKLNSSKAANFVKDLERYGITVKDALRIGSNESFDVASKTSIGKKNLNDAGILAANRDAIIPQVSNRLLFTQSNTPWVRLLGQFLSWSMAKSAQTNKILSRIENGDARTMVKLLAALPVYGGIQELRELAKYGEVVTDIGADTDEWWAESIRLSGLPGVLPEFLASNLVGPGSRQPFFLAFPAGSIAFESDKILRDYLKGNTERATERFFQRIAPLPNWRKFIIERAKDLGVDFDDAGRKLPESKLERRQFNTGDLVTKDKRLGNLSSKILEQGVTADLLKQSVFNDKQKFNIGGAVAKAITKGITKATGKATSKNLTKDISTEINKTVSKSLLDEVNPGDTAITSTLGTYKKVDNILTDLNKNTVHDFGAGIGIGTRIFKNKNVTSHEPFVPIEKILKSKINFEGELFKGRVPDYKNFDDVLFKEGASSKDAVVNLNVLNVIADKNQRANVVKQIGQLIKDDGVAVITTRGDKEIINQAKEKFGKNWKDYLVNDGFIFGNKKKTFQKGFSQKELEKYVQDILGDLFKVEKIPNKYGISTSGVIIKKSKPKFAEGDEVIVPPKKPYDITAFVKRIR